MIYEDRTFNSLMRESYGYDQKQQDNSFSWKLAHSLYIKNYQESRRNNGNNIPKIIHQIWLGSLVPEKYAKFMKSWKEFNPTWEYKLWTDKDAGSIKMVNRNAYDAATNMGMKSDILRYEILQQFGGVYVDTDFECLKSFNSLAYLDFFTGISYDSEFVLYNGLIGTIPNHPIINTCIEFLKTKYTGNKGSMIMKETGPYYFTGCFEKAMIEMRQGVYNGVVAFPMQFFYPFPNDKKQWGNDPYSYISDYSYAIHHWDSSWSKNKTK